MEKEKSTLLQTLQEQGEVTFEHQLLVHGKHMDKPLVIWELPPIGSEVIILQHLYFDRKKTHSQDLYGLEEEPARKYVVYRVDSYTHGIENPYTLGNFMVLKCMRGLYEETRVIPTREIACGFFRALVLTEEEVRDANEFRKEFRKRYI